MAKERKPKPKDDLLLRFLLSDIEPKIWREVVVEGNTKLDFLHQIIQSLFMWEDSHLHQFVFKGKYYGSADLLENDDVTEESNIEVGSLLVKVGDKLNYEYDFGDGWNIEVKLIGLWDTIEAEYFPRPICLGGERAAPPEDCGGVPGYYDLVESLKNSGSPECIESLTLLGCPWDPESFDNNAANFILSRDLEAFQMSESQGILDGYVELVTEQLENKTYRFANTTFLRLTKDGLDERSVITLMALAFMRERTLTKDLERIDEIQYANLLSQLPNLPWLEEAQFPNG